MRLHQEMKKIIFVLRNSRIYVNAINSFRSRLQHAKSKEELCAYETHMFKLFSFLFFINSPRKNPKRNVQDKLEFFLSHIEKGQSVLDVGCYDGYYTQKLREHGYEVIGLDSLKPIIDIARKEDTSGNYVHGFAEELPFKDDIFDVGLYSHILHHVFNPEAALSEARRVIKPKGKIIVAVPKKFGLDANHLRCFSQENLQGLLSRYFSRIEYYSSIGIGHGCIAYKE